MYGRAGTELLRARMLPSVAEQHAIRDNAPRVLIASASRLPYVSPSRDYPAAARLTEPPGAQSPGHELADESHCYRDTTSLGV